MSIRDTVHEAAMRAKQASAVLRTADPETKRNALLKMAQLLRAKSNKIKQANAIDMENGEEKGLSSAMLDRLKLTDDRIEDMAIACEEIAELEDPVGEVLDEWTRPNGMRIQKVSVPIGVVGIIYESRPNVTVDAACLCMKAGNAVLLRGGSEAINSNVALAEILQGACQEVGLPANCVEIVRITDRQAVREMAQCDEYLGLIVPRGGAGLIRAVTEQSTVPVLKHERGMTQIYVDGSCDIDLAVGVVHNSKVQRPGVCNAVENIYIHSGNTEAAEAILSDLIEAGVEVRGCERTQEVIEGVKPATDEDFDTEYLDLIVSVKMVDSMQEALEEIDAHTSGLTECIITDNDDNAEHFLANVDSAAVYHNVSTRFTDGGQFGLGAEIGVSTDRLHARGPVAVRDLTIYKYVVRGEGQGRDASDKSMQAVRGKED